MAFQKFEDIIAWQKSRSVNKLIYSATSDERFARDFALRDQIRRSSISIMANIAEGFGRRSDKEFANFLNIARGSAFEVQSHLYVALDLGYINEIAFKELYARCVECCIRCESGFLNSIIHNDRIPLLLWHFLSPVHCQKL